MSKLAPLVLGAVLMLPGSGSVDNLDLRVTAATKTEGCRAEWRSGFDAGPCEPLRGCRVTKAVAQVYSGSLQAMAAAIAVPVQPPGLGLGLPQVPFGWPLPEPVVVARAFDGPAQPWLAGHRGVDLTGPVAAPVLAPAAGTVSFNGWIVDRHVVVIDHGQLRSTLEPVRSDLTVGSTLLRGQVVGHLATDQAAHCPGCLHWGVRLGQTYLDPVTLVDRLPRAVLWE